METPIPLLLIHGFGGGMRDYRALQRFLAAHGYTNEIHTFLYKRKYGQVSLEELADELAEYIRTRMHTTFSVVAYSQGGLIFRTCMLRHPELAQQVEKVITVCTPHQGSIIAYLGIGKGVKDLRPNSALLQKLDAHDDGLRYYAVYNPFDPVVFPGTNARFPKAIINERVPGISHSLTFGNARTLAFIERTLLV
jgi:triacylglycerol lipase